MKARTICLIALLLYFSHSYSAIFMDQGIEKDVAETELILIGKLIEKNYNAEERKRLIYKRNKNGEMEKLLIDDDPVYTIFSFKILEVIKGDYSDSTIDLYMLGGCINDRCEKNSVNYDFVPDEEALLFMQFIPENGFYISANASHLIFTIDPSTNLALRKSEAYISPITSKLKKSSENQISIDLIKGLANEK